LATSAPERVEDIGKAIGALAHGIPEKPQVASRDKILPHFKL
jgi:hypothetical protein